MFNVCPSCGLYSEEKAVDPAGPCAVCPACGHRHRFRWLPLFWITGSSGTGKSTLCLELAASATDCVFLEADILWRREFADAQDGYRSYHNTWLRVAKNISQAGRPVALFGGGMPERIESCPERRYLRAVHYLALVCDEDELIERLRTRPRWRDTSSPEFLQRMVEWNRHLIEHAATTEPPMTLLNTARLSVADARAAVLRWIQSCLSEEGAAALGQQEAR